MNYAFAAQQTVVKVGMKTDVWDLVMQSGLIVKFVLLTLFAFSVFSWAIILSKKVQLSKITRMNSKFLDSFWRSGSLEIVYGEIDRYLDSPLAQVFKAGYLELQRIAEGHDKQNTPNFASGNIENISRALRKASDNEISRIEGRAAFLATVGSTAPFIGLFGTVWGIMTAFQNIGATGAASLAVVAPGISEALVTTAVGLAAAIPAVMAYNFFVGKFKKQDLEISNFSSDFLNIVKRNFFKD